MKEALDVASGKVQEDQKEHVVGVEGIRTTIIQPASPRLLHAGH